MPIEALPPTAITKIGSTQCLTDPHSVVKELIDNAIDARATAIFVEISTNTLDKIQVRDNGHGIAPEDRALVCKRYCTSKIRDLNDLHQLSGLSLGFRGEALASAVDMSHRVVLVTRVDGEPTAVEVTYSTQALMTNEKRISHPLGTTVTISDFLRSLPVRRQTALKEKAAAVQLSKIRGTLQAYALARPHIRLSLKVLKAKDEKGNWMYAPKPGALDATRIMLVKDAASKVFGPRVIDQCRLLSWKKTNRGSINDIPLKECTDIDIDEDTEYAFQALVPKVESDIELASIDKPRQFLSIDTRPVSGARGTPKQIITTFKKYLKSARSRSSVDKSSDPILCLDITCRPGSYDANVEPAKDNVLFADPSRLLEAAETFFQLIYGKQSEAVRKDSPAGNAVAPESFDLLLSRNERPCPDILRPAPGRIQQGNSAYVARGKERLKVRTSGVRGAPVVASIDNASSLSESRAHNNTSARKSMYNAGGDELMDSDLLEGELDSPLRPDKDADPVNINDVSISNPWAIATFNAAVHRPAITSSSNSNIEAHNGLPTPKRQQGDILTSPGASSDTLEDSAEQHSRILSPKSAWSPPPFPFPQQLRGRRFGEAPASRRENVINDEESHTQRALDAWLQNNSNGTVDHEGMLEGNPSNHDSQYGRDFVSARRLPRGTPLNAIPDASQKPREKRRHQKGDGDVRKSPFIPPVKDPHNVWFSSAQHQRRAQHKNTVNEARPPTREAEALNPPAASPPPSFASSDSIHPDLAETMAYETRKQQALQHHKQQAKQQERERRRQLEQNLTSRRAPLPAGGETIMSPPWSSPYRNRQLKARAALQAPATPIDRYKETFEQGDPRAFLINEQATSVQATSKPRRLSKRARTAMLPLETVTSEEYVHELVLQLSTSVSAVGRDVIRGLQYQDYIVLGEEQEGLVPVSEADVARWQAVLERLVRERVPKQAPAGLTDQALAEVRIDLRRAFDERWNAGG